MGRGFKEVAHLNTNLDAYAEGYDHIFKKYKCNCHLFEDCSCDICKPKEDQDQIQNRIVSEEFGPCDL
jgi:hypothetical protein